MLLVMSDLHFQDNLNDAIQWSGGLVGLERNVPRKAFEHVFESALDYLSQICTAFGGKRAEFEKAEPGYHPQLHVIIAGDCFDLHRSPLWFRGGNAKVPRPYDTNYPKTSDPLLPETEAMLLDAFDAIEASNPDMLGPSGLFAELQAGRFPPPKGLDGVKGAEITLDLIPGNHESELYRSGKLRERARRLLGMPNPSENPFPFRLPFPSHRAFVRHGHEYDGFNFASQPPRTGTYDPKPDIYRVPVLGDVLTTEFAVRLVTSFRARHALKLRAKNADGDIARDLYFRLLAFDDVRDTRGKIEYVLSGFQGGQNRAAWALLRPVLGEVVTDLVNDRRLLGHPDATREIPGALRTILGVGPFRDIASNVLRQKDPERLLDILSLFSPGSRAPSETKEYGPLLRDVAFTGEHDARLLVYGHTHHPCIRVLRDAGGDTPLTHINTGTWRIRIEPAADGLTFVQTKAIGYVEVYSKAERQHAGRPHYNFWDGRRPATDGGLSVLARATSGRKSEKRTLKFNHLVVHRIDEGSTGAELRAVIGVAGVAGGGDFTLSQGSVKNGASIALGKTLTVDCPPLGADVFIYGFEEDYGDSWADPDDPLPSGLFRIDSSNNFGLDHQGKSMTHTIEAAGTKGRYSLVFEVAP